MLEHEVELKGEENKWEFLDKRVGIIFKKYCDFVGLAMKKREQLRTIEKLRSIKEIDILNDITNLRIEIDNKCTKCLECLTNAYLEGDDNEMVEKIYQNYVWDFYQFLEERVSNEIKEVIDVYGNVFYQENM